MLKNLNKNLKEENDKLNRLEEKAIDELRDYKKEILKKDIDIYDNKPIMQKIVFILAGFSNFLIGYALFFVLKDDKDKKWKAACFGKGATASLIFLVIGSLFEIVRNFIIK